MTNKILTNPTNEQVVDKGASIAEWEQSKVREIRNLLRQHKLLIEQDKLGDAKKAQKQYHLLLEQLHKRNDYRLKRFADRFIRGHGSSRQYLAPIITAEELHAELRASFVQEIMAIDGKSSLDWEGSFLSALSFFARRVTRKLVEDNGFYRQATQKIKSSSLTAQAHGEEGLILQDTAEDIPSKLHFHLVEVDPTFLIFTNAVKRELQKDVNENTSEAKRRKVERHIQLFELMSTDANRKQMADILNVNATTIYDDIAFIKAIARGTLIRLKMIPSDLIGPH